MRKFISRFIFTFIIVFLQPAFAAIEMKRVELPQVGVSVELPKDFTVMPEELAKIKYPYGTRPQVIYSDEKGAVSFGINKMPPPSLISTDELKDITLKNLKNLSPEATPVIISGYKGWIITFELQAIDTDIINKILIIKAGETDYLATFNFTKDNMAKYQSIADESLKSLIFDKN